MARGGDQRLHGEGGAGAQDGADIVGIGDLVEERDDAVGLEFVQAGGGQGIGLEDDALVDGARLQLAVEFPGMDDLGIERQGREAGSQPLLPVPGQPETAQFSLGVGERRLDGMDPVYNVCRWFLGC